MKELSIEEKAKAYDEALERAESIYNETVIPSATTKGICTYIFPELKESENADEKVRKTLIKLVTNHASMDLFIEYDIHLDEALAWLEKQGEQKQEWSEEDRLHYMNVLEELEYVKGCKSDYDKIEAVKSDIAWFKSLRPQNTWKLSDEQIIALRWVLNNIPYNKHKEEISRLLDQIKDLSYDTRR